MNCGYEWTADMMNCGYDGSVDMMNCGYDGAADDLWMAVLIDDVLIEGRIDYSGVGEW